jgi:hypothetical protein
MGKQAIGGGFTGPGGMKLPFPKAVRAGDFVFVSGQMATEADGRLVDGGIEVQTRQVMDNIKTILPRPAAPWRTCQVHLLDRRCARLRPLQYRVPRVFRR